MQLQKRIESFVALGKHLSANTLEWQETKQTAEYKNGWFTQENIHLATQNIVNCFLQETILGQFVTSYKIQETTGAKKVGLIMAGNIPMVGFHDLLCILISGHHLVAKLSSKDEVLMQYIITFLQQHNADWKSVITTAEMLKNCDAYIATGSNNSSLVFEHYFAKWPNIIRKNRTSVAVLNGTETKEQLMLLADDVHCYFGLGCRNVTKLYVPTNYNFEQLIESFKTYQDMVYHNKYKNNYDYNLALYLLNNQYYMTNGAVLLVENPQLFSPISTLHYEYYTDENTVKEIVENNTDVQCIIGKNYIAFGQSQQPSISNFADGADTMQFLTSL